MRTIQHTQAGGDIQGVEGQLRLMLDNIPALVVCALPGGSVEFVNQGWQEYTGCSFRELTGWGWKSVVHPEDVSKFMDDWCVARPDGVPLESEARLRRADGQYHWFLMSTVPVRNEADHVVRWYGTALNIEARKQADDQLQLVLNATPALIHTSRPDGYLDFFNQNWLKYVGQSLADVQGWNWTASIHPDDVEGIVGKWRASLASGEPFLHESRVRRADGEYRWMLHHKIALKNEYGEIVKWYGSSIDIEDRIRAEDTLRAAMSERTRLSAVRAEVGMALASKDSLREILHTCTDAIVRHLDAACARIWTLSHNCQELELQASAGMYSLPDGRYNRVPLGQNKIGCIASEKKAYLTNDVRNDLQFSSDWVRDEKIVAFAGYPLVVDDRVVGVLGVFAQGPITESTYETLLLLANGIAQGIDRKHADEQLRRSEAYLAEAQRLSHTGSFGWNVLSGEVASSDETYQIFECDRASKLTLDIVLQRIHPEDRTFLRETINRASAESTDFDIEHRLLMPDGAVKFLRVVAHAMRGPTGDLEFVGAVSDITATKLAEERIRKNERELQQLVDFIPDHISILESDGSRTFANQVTLDYYGVTLEEWRQEDTYRRVIHPDDLNRVLTDCQRGIANGVPFEIEMRLLGKNRKYRWFLSRCKPLLDDIGRIARWCSTSTDIEDRKQNEERLRNQNVALREEVDKTSMFEEIVGSSAPLQRVLSCVSKVAPTDSTVLIMGETGTGKELVARAIHRRSQRSSRAFVSMNCSAIPRDLIASELFGHEKGSFTGATQRRMGRFELADGGTLFLDEIGELPAETQVALLRVLQEHEFERVGGTRSIQTDVRVIAATNRDLQAAITAGVFRRDLFYRLNVIPIEIPPLRERKEDILLLVEYFIDRFARKAGKNIRRAEKKTLDLLCRYPWPGNIRELQNVIERSVIVCETETFSVDERWLSRPATEVNSPLDLSEALAAQEREMIEAALRECEGQVSGAKGAAAKLGMARSTLESKIRSFKINKVRFKAAA